MQLYIRTLIYLSLWLITELLGHCFTLHFIFAYYVLTILVQHLLWFLWPHTYCFFTHAQRRKFVLLHQHLTTFVCSACVADQKCVSMQCHYPVNSFQRIQLNNYPPLWASYVLVVFTNGVKLTGRQWNKALLYSSNGGRFL